MNLTNSYNHSTEICDIGCKDRTGEFRSVIRSLQSSCQFGGMAMGYSRSSPVSRGSSEFKALSKKISGELSSTSVKLEKLSLLTNKKSLNNDKSSDIQQLTDVIKKDLTSLNSQIGQLQNLSKSSTHVSSRHKVTHCHAIVVTLQSKLAGMSGDFKALLEVRTENLKHQHSGAGQYSTSNNMNSHGHANAYPGNTAYGLLPDERHNSSAASTTVINMDNVARQRQRQGQNTQQLQLMEEQSPQMDDERVHSMSRIEQTIVELGGIFQQLASMVQEQEEVVQRIDSHVEETHLNIDLAHNELVRYLRTVTSNRSFMIKVFLVLIFFFILFVVFMA